MPDLLWMFCGPCRWGTISEALTGCVGKGGQDVGEVFAYGDVEAATAFDRRDDCRYSRSGLLTPDMDPVASADRYGPHRILRKVVAEFQFRIIEEADQSFPDTQCVAAALAGSALGQHRLAHLLDASADLSQQRRSFLVAQSVSGSVVHVFIACLSIDGEQLIDQFHRADRGGILLVEFDRIDEVPSRVAPA